MAIYNGTTGNDTVTGLSGDDKLYGLDGNDILDGGNGDDTLSGAAGDDTYLFSAGSGYDTIAEYSSSGSGSGTDKLVLTGLNKADVTFQKANTWDLKVTINSTDESVYIQNEYYGDINWNIESFVFKDGTLIQNDINTQLNTGGSGDDTLWGWTGRDSLSGLSGNDKLYGLDGNDTLDGGNGDDTLSGAAGDDTYLFSAGSGYDTIAEYSSSGSGSGTDKLVLTGLNKADVTFQKANTYDLKITINSTDESVYIQNEYYGDINWNIESFVFKDGTLIQNDINTQLNTGGSGDDTLWGWTGRDSLSGLSGNDKLYGLDGNDTLDGGSGDDTLSGGAGDDTYLFSVGSGYDTIGEYSSSGSGSGTDKLVLAGINKADVTFQKANTYDLKITINSTGESVYIQNEYYGDINWNIESFVFKDGTLGKRDTEINSSLPTDTKTTQHAPTGDVIIKGNTVKGQTLAASNTLADTDGLGTISYLWQANGVNLGTGNSYTLTGNEVGKTITATAKYTDLLGTAESVSSAATAPVTNSEPNPGTPVNHAPTGAVSITGNTIKGQTLTASNTLADADGLGSVSYLWQANGVNLGTGNSYILTGNEVGKTVTATAKYTDLLGTAESVGSAATAIVTDNTSTPATPPSDSKAINGTAGNDTITGTSTAELINGLAGHDVIYGNEGNDTLNGGAGYDYLVGGKGDDTLNGGDDVDAVDYYYYETTGPITVNLALGSANGSGIGTDTLSSIETVYGSFYADILIGDTSINYLCGMDGNDWLDGAAGDDVLWGGVGGDILIGGAGSDWLYGGSGADSFYFTANQGTDFIADFNTLEDKVSIAAGTNGISNGVQAVAHLSTNAFGNAVLDLGQGNSVVLVGVPAVWLNSSMFAVIQ